MGAGKKYVLNTKIFYYNFVRKVQSCTFLFSVRAIVSVTFDVVEASLISSGLLQSHHVQHSAVDAAPTNGNFCKPFNIVFLPLLMHRL